MDRPWIELIESGVVGLTDTAGSWHQVRSDFCGMQDFSGFRVICLLPRLRPNWPAPGAYETEVPKACSDLGAPKNPLPCLLTNAKPLCSATIRCGKGYLEIPFFATKESRRGQGLGRCLLDAIQSVAR